MDQQEAMNAGRWLTHPEGTTLPSHSMMGIFAFFRPDQGSCSSMCRQLRTPRFFNTQPTEGSVQLLAWANQ